ncbi:hypothetical protein GCM10023186_03070 [Hymenobacter koreensis]|uniref:Transmembrane protein n=1 Tax=Hymenobacter koreensis TaxID=1084523 RepID=A0ABP8IUF4_9BACT
MLGWTLLGLLPFAVLSFFNHPFYDDYMEAIRVRQYGLWGAQKHLYFHWTGRFFTSFLLTVGNPLTYDWVPGIRLTPLFFLVLIWSVFYLAVRYLASAQLSRKWSVWVAALALLLYLGAAAQVYQAFYWFTSAVVYQAGNAMLALTVFLSGYRFRSSGRAKYVLSFGAILAAIATASSNEVALVQLVVVLGVLSGISYWQKTNAWQWWVGLLVVTLSIGVIATAAPGNFARLHVVHPLHARELTYAVPRTIYSAIEFLAVPRVWIMLAMVVAVCVPWAARNASLTAFKAWRLHPLIALAAWLGTLLMGFFPFWWMWASYTPVRTQNAILFGALLSIPPLVQAVMGWYAARHRSGIETVRSPIPGWITAWGILLALGTISGAAILPAWRELLVNAMPFESQMQARYRALAQARAQGWRELTLPPMAIAKPQAILVHEEDLKPQASEERNRVTAMYYGLDSLRVPELNCPGSAVTTSTNTPITAYD